MKKSGIIHPQLNHALSLLGHTDTFVIADCGLPIPEHVERIDLAFALGSPSIESVLEAIIPEVVVESAVIAREAHDSGAGQILAAQVPGALEVSHEEFKERVTQARFVVRTGSTVPYANVIVSCGVPF